MTSPVVTFLLVRLILPAAMLFSIALRPFGLSLIYLLLFLISPLTQVPNPRTAKSGRSNFLLVVAFVSVILLFVHIVWHSVLASFPPYGVLVELNELLRQIAYNLGLVSYSHADTLMIIHYIAPELVMSVTSIVVYVMSKKMTDADSATELKRDHRHQRYPLLVSLGKYLSLLLIMFSGILWPSVTSAIYFLIFIIFATLWALDWLIDKAFAVVSILLMAIMAVHSAVILVYQCNWAIEFIPPDMNFARYFGLIQIVNLNATTQDYFTYQGANTGQWTTLASPLVILVTYYVLGIESRELFKPKGKSPYKQTGVESGKTNGSLVRGVSLQFNKNRSARDRWMAASRKAKFNQVVFEYIDSKALRGNAGERTPLIGNTSPSKTMLSLRTWSVTRQSRQDSVGSVLMTDFGNDSETEVHEPTLSDDIIIAIIEFFQVLVRSSYIATTITMMAWSIMYHSWLAFVFLMWANLVWLCPNQRSVMLKTSPVLVVYAICLLIAQYVYAMQLTEEELPSHIKDVNLKQIGLGRSPGEPVMPLLIKSLFTCMFWVTLRQRVQERRARMQAAALADMAAPLQLTVSTAASVIEAQKEEENKSRILKAIGDFLRAACARYWIYVVAIMLFVIGITGERMTIFRIIYMFLFLAFILIFQISWYWWRRLMYVFWVVVIIYSMINLILLYIYQFDNTSRLIENYLFINKKLQHDLGLEPYDPADLFVKLLTPTLFLIITIMQVHYFHKDFMMLSDIRTRSTSRKDGQSSRPSQGASTIKDDIPQLPEDEGRGSPEIAAGTGRSTELSTYNTADKLQRAIPKSLSHTATTSTPFRLWIMQRHRVWKKVFLEWVELFFAYLDIHLPSIIFIALMLLCVLNVCALHVPIMLIICLSARVNYRRKRYSILIISVLISVYFMAKMVYQIDYIHARDFDVNCTSAEASANGSKIQNNAEWIGFVKTSPDKRLVTILKGYIALIALFTFNSLVIYRQELHRELNNISHKNATLLFPEIRREHADKDLIHCIKYLFNYGFYKFGVEISLVCMIGVIGSRMDLYAALYAIWLFTLVSLERRAQTRVWPTFVAFITIIVPLQYLIAVGFLPQFCITYPWSGNLEQMKHVRNWVFLPYSESPPHAIKLIFDYFLLLFATMQHRVFMIEKQHGDNYAGGSNSEDIGQDWETPNFVNPVPDFLGFVGTWLDIIKRMVFLGMLWLTLAIMFMTGTNRVNLFSTGYLIGSFIFLWQGTDFYLLPKKSILQWWSWLLRYNVSVVVIKTLLQVPGCIFSQVVQTHACWLVQLLGIGCVDKFAGGTIKFIRNEPRNPLDQQTCTVPQEDIGLAWDGVCFAFLILQRRLFHSYYFFRVIDESKATTVLASRGAELIEELRMKQMKLQEEQEIKILEKIKVKMEKIKANQKKVQGVHVKDPGHHDEDEDEEDSQQGEGEDECDTQSEQVPLVCGDSDASARGFHTPDSPASPRGFHTPVSESSPPATPPPTRPTLPALPAPLTSSSHGGPPSPSSALLTSLSLDAYLEPRRISFESPPSSDLVPRAQSPEESYPVFSPPPIRRRHTVASPSLLQRTSMISQSSRSEPKTHHSSRACPPYRPPASHQKAVRSGDYYMFDDFDDTELTLKKDEEEIYDADVPRQMGLGQLVSTAFKTDLKHALLLRRASMPMQARRRSSVTPMHSMIQEVRRRFSTGHAVQGPVDTPKAADDGGARDEPSREHTLLEDYAPTPEAGTWIEKVQHVIDTITAFVSSFLVSLTRQLMKYSRDYRYVSRTLTLEKKILKEKGGFGIGLREGSQMRWEPLPEPLHLHRKLSEISVPEIRILAPSMERGLDASPAPSRRSRLSCSSRSRSGSPANSRSVSHARSDEDGTSEHESAFSLQSTKSKDLSMLQENDDSMFKHDRSPLVHFIFAVWYTILAHTDIVCYIMVFINQIQSATILSIPLPLMVFLWGTLTIPRPTKTFWVTLIAYTEVIVLIKSMFQFEILPWNQNVIPANMPFTAPRIIGIERKSNYALYDLLLLLIIFLHRFMLKSLGLWKETSTEVELREDMEFPLQPEDTQKLVEGYGVEVGKKYVAAHDRTGPRHRLVDRQRHVQMTIEEAMRELDASRSDPRVLQLVHLRLQRLRSERTSLRRRPRLERRSRLSQQPLLDEPFQRNSDLDSRQVEEDSSSSSLGARDVQPEPGPSKPSNAEDDHYKVDDDQEPIIAVTTTLEDKQNYCPNVIWLSLKRYLRPCRLFFQRIMARGARVTADVYAYMFLCDFFNFLVVIFGFAAFGTHQGDGGVQTYLEENKVPIPFLVMLILQFVLIVIDRALYLRKFMLGKILFQYALIIGVHIWMFFILPFITERTFNTLPPPPMWYMMKCIYLLLSAYQIRCGYPRRIIGNFLCQSYNFINMVAFRGFMAVPFVFELRTLMDWIWTDTSMTLMDWLKMEDIFANVFLLKCSRYVEDEFPSERGLKKSSSSKYLLGGTVLAFVIAIIWFPLVFFAFGNTVGQPNPPTDVTVKIRIGPFLPVYQMTAQSHNIELFKEQDYALLSNMYQRDRTAQTFLSNYVYNDVAVVNINSVSSMKWVISPPELNRLRGEVEANNSLTVKFTFVITHPSNNAQNPPTIEDSREVVLQALDKNGKRTREWQKLSNMLNTTDEDVWINVKLLFPKFLKVFNKGTAKPAYQLIPTNELDSDAPPNDERLYRNVQMQLIRDANSMYWQVRENCDPKEMLKDIPYNNCDMLVMYTFNDKLFPETLNFISGGGIIGLYTTFVFLASRVIRGFFSGIYTKIMFDDLPNVDRVLQLCLDIYLVREALELSLEEDLFAKLVFLYRSPETMIKWSRPKEEPDQQRALPSTP